MPDFSNVIAQDHGNWSVIQRYHQSLLNYCQQLTDQGQFDTAKLQEYKAELCYKAPLCTPGWGNP